MYCRSPLELIKKLNVENYRGEEEEEVVVVVVVIIIIIAVTHMKKYKQTRGGFGILFPSNETLYSQKWEEDGRERNYTLSHATCL